MAMNHFDHVGIINGHRSNIIVVNFINNHYNHQHSLINFPAAASTTCIIYHGIFAFTIPTAISLVQMRFPDQHLFHKHPVTMTVILCSIITYSLAFSLELLLLHQHSVSGTSHDDVYPRNWSIAFGSLSLASVLGLLFSPPFSWRLWLPVLLCFLLLTLLAFAPKLVAPVGELFSRFHRGGNRLSRRTSSPLLPLSAPVSSTSQADSQS
ncbi:PREDICTED: PRUPE_2G142700 [Prunus dulcis]|uniref:PREDICTED: PRUPE_2G142700 n=1 Tax=Prunus dulcis TaxID=3755 RepID=A0A5E4GKT8_PRUDU|nr:PREDICTED: PRUPE_2G142700 [Prunus dulcis]